jgi:nitrogenase iron protein NifH
LQRIVIYGKGGIGKSTVATALSMAYAQAGKRVLHVGCDPKHDSAMKLVPGGKVPTVLELLLLGRTLTREQMITAGRLGIHCVEAGGPDPGVGCGGRGITKMFEVMERARVIQDGAYDVVVYDVLGDVVCGGFAAPLKAGAGQKVVIVVSEELMALYAANNVAKVVRTYGYNGLKLAGLVVNLRDNSVDLGPLRHFAQRLGTRILAVVPRSREVREAELDGVTVLDAAPGSEAAARLRALAQEVLALDPATCPEPTPLDHDTFLQEAGAILKATGA